jgi:hypothetical protein
MTEQAQNHLTHPVEDWGGLPTRDTIIAHLSTHPEHAWRYPAGYDFGPPIADGTTGLDWAARHRKHHLASPEAEETAAILADPETMAAIVEAQAETGTVSPELRRAADDAWDA